MTTLFSKQALRVNKDHALKALRAMHLTRFLDEKMGKLVRQNKGGTFHLSMAGHEMIGALSALALRPGVDWGLPYYRDRAFAVGLGCSAEDLLAAFLARDISHHSGGRMMPEHFSSPELRIPCQSSCVGSQFLQAVGVAKSAALRGASEVVYVSGGDGSTSQGDFHETLNFACIHRLPLVVVIQDNGWAISVTKEEQTAGGTIAKIAAGYEGLSVFEVDGCDYLETTAALEQAVAKARSQEGPSLVVARVPRIGPHSSSDDPKKYKTEACAADDVAKDPVRRFEEWLLREGILDAASLRALQEAHRREVEEAALRAEEIPFPPKESAADHVFKPFAVEGTETEGAGGGESIVMMDALNHALLEEMERDSGVVVFGQDVAKGKGGVFGITRGLTDRFGPARCFNTPLAESTIIGVALGLSLDGVHKPVAEIQFADYSWTGMNQLFNELSSFHYRSKGQWHCPVVIRMPYGGYIQGGPYHSQSIEAFLCHCPGLKVAIPSNAADAKRLLKAAIRDPNPVIFLEHKALYRQRLFSARPEPGENDLLPFGKARVVREGSDVTVVGWGMTVLMAYEAAETAAKEAGVSTEVIDLRTLSPLDFDTVLASIRKTGKLLIAHEAPRTCGFGAELAARAAAEAFSFLDAPVVRVAGKDCPVPYCKELEDAVLPQTEDILQALQQLAAF
jgi:2-oxoisovalerate dehydrogenase E1 component